MLFRSRVGVRVRGLTERGMLSQHMKVVIPRVGVRVRGLLRLLDASASAQCRNPQGRGEGPRTDGPVGPPGSGHSRNPQGRGEGPRIGLLNKDIVKNGKS